MNENSMNININIRTYKDLRAYTFAVYPLSYMGIQTGLFEKTRLKWEVVIPRYKSILFQTLRVS